MNGTAWDRRLSVHGDGKWLIGHAGAVLLRKCADQTGLTGALGAVFARLSGTPVWDRGVALVQLAVAITLGATSMRQIALLSHHEQLFGTPPSDSTVRRSLEPIGDDERMWLWIVRARARVRRHVWTLITRRDTGFPWLQVAGKVLTGWVVIDLDATLISAHSPKEGAAPAFKRGFGFHPLAAWCANTHESLAMRGIRRDWQVNCDITLDDPELSTYWWHGRLIPFGYDVTGGNLFVDPDTGRTGSFHSEDGLHPGDGDIWPSYLALLKVTARALERGEPVRGRQPRIEKDRLDWRYKD